MSDELKPGETRVYDKHGRLVATNRGLVGQGGGGGPSYFPTIIRPEVEKNSEQETEIARLRAENKELLEALKPFATAAYSNMGGGLNHLHTICSIITLDDLRRARAIFSRAQKKSGEGNGNTN